MKLFNILSPGGDQLWCTSLPNVRGSGPVHDEVVSTADQLDRFLEQYDHPGRALYHCVATLQPGAPRNKENVISTSWVWGEVDFKDHPDLTPAEILRRIRAMPMPPSRVVFSGHGYHLYWRLNEPIDASPGEGQRQLEDALKLVCAYIGGDPQVAEAARLMRLPGSHNTRIDGERLLVEGIEDNGNCYEVDDLVDHWLEVQPILPPPVKPEKKSNGHGDHSDFEQPAEEADGPIDVEARLEAMTFQGPGDSSISKTQLQVSGALTARGSPVDQTAELVLEHTRRAGKGAPDYARWDWRAEEAAIRRMCYRLVNKAMCDGRDLSHTLPDKLADKWADIINKGGLPQIKNNRFGDYVIDKIEMSERLKAAWETRSGQTGKANSNAGGDNTSYNTNGNDREDNTGEAPHGNDRKDSTGPRKQRICLQPYDAMKPSTLPRREWLYGFHYMRRIVSATVGPGGIGKSTLGLVEAVSMSLGRDLLGSTALSPLRVWYHNGEDPREELNRRIGAICLFYKIDEQEVRKNMFVTCGLDMPIKIAKGQQEVVLDKLLVKEITARIQEHKVDVAIFDPLVTLHATGENAIMSMDPVLREGFGVIANLTNAAIEIAHHTRKKHANQGEYTSADARGASSIVDAVRGMRVTNQMSTAEAEEFGIDPLDRFDYLRLSKGKANMTRGGVGQWFQFHSVSLPNGDDDNDIPGDDVGVLAPWEPPDTRIHYNDAARLYMQDLVRQDPNWREDGRAKKWIGNAIASKWGLDLDKKADKRRVIQIYDSLVKEGVLIAHKREDEGRRLRFFVCPGTWVPKPPEEGST